MRRFIGLLGWIGVLLVVAAVVLRFTRPDLLPWSQRVALAGLVVTGLYALTQWRDIAAAFGGRGMKYGSMAVVSVVLMVAILAAINWVTNRQNRRWDLTAAGQFSLSDQTRQILASLDEPLTIRVFYVRSATAYRDQLMEYAYQSSQVNVEYVDAERDPLQAQQYAIETVPTLVFEYAGRTERASAVDEQTVTNALKRVIEGAAKTVYFLQGHGEHDPTSSEPDGYATLAAALGTDNFTVETLTLAQAGEVPADATVLVAAGPQTDLLEPELELIRGYLDRGGKLHLLVDPPEDAAAPPLTNFLALAAEWGVEFGDDLVIDASGIGRLLGTDAAVPIAMAVPHPITNNFGTVMTAFPLARSVSPIPGGTEGRQAQPVLQTGPQSWAESDIAAALDTGLTERNLNQGDTAGPVTIAAAVAAAAPAPPAPAPDPAEGDNAESAAPAADTPAPETRVVVVGDSDFGSNQAVGIQGNREIFLNMVNWLAQQEDLIAIRPRDPQDRPITMTADQGRMVFWLTMFIVPALLFANGIRVYWRKR